LYLKYNFQDLTKKIDELEKLKADKECLEETRGRRKTASRTG